MIQRSNHLSIYVILTGILLLSVGLNILQYKRINDLQRSIHNGWVTDAEYQQIKQEIERLEKNPFGVN